MPPSPTMPSTRMFGARARTRSVYSSFISTGGRWKRTHSPDRISPEGISLVRGGAGASQTAHVAARKLTGAWHTVQCGNSLEPREGREPGVEEDDTGSTSGLFVIQASTYDTRGVALERRTSIAAA